MTPFNKWVVLGLKNLDSFKKHVGLILTHIVGFMSWRDTNPIHEHKLPFLIPYMQVCVIDIVENHYFPTFILDFLSHQSEDKCCNVGQSYCFFHHLYICKIIN